jgi:hypothetical protein
MRLLTGLVVIVLGLFYVAWPAWSAYQLKLALESGDAAGVERGIDFPAVRQSLRPAVTAGIEQNLKAATKGTPGSDLLIEKISSETLPKLVDASLDTLLTPQTLIRLHAEGKSLRDFINSMKSGQPDLAGQVGGLVRDLFGKKSDSDGQAPKLEGVAAASPIVPENRRLGLGNIKSVGLDGPFAISIGLARDPKATEADLTATMSLDGAGWRITRLVPRI